MFRKKYFWLILLALVLGAAVLVACGDETMSPEDCYDDEVYDAQDQMCYAADDSSTADDGSASESEAMSPEDCYDDEEYDEQDQMCYLIEDGSTADDSYAGYDEYDVMSPEDCYDDEEYDEQDQMCYLIEDDSSLDEDYYTLAGDLFDTYVSGEDTFQEGDATADQIIIRYGVQGNQLTSPELGAVTGNLRQYQNDTEMHQRIWVYFANLIPADQRQYITGFGLYTDGEGEVLAYVEPNIDNPQEWSMYVDVIDAANADELTYTLVHEFAHILTLNDRQVPFDSETYFQEDEDVIAEAEQACPTYFTGEGCSRSNSYINAFFEQFWADIYDEWLDTDPESDEFYSRHEEMFVTDYAATNPGEDIAESFTMFVLQPKPEGDTVAEEKILFFYSYPELVQLRTEIAGRAYSRLRR